MATRARSTFALGLVACLAATCEDLTPPLKNPVMHDMTVTTTVLVHDFNSQGIRERVPVNYRADVVLAVDFGTRGARIDPAGPCGLTSGRLTERSGTVTAEFESGENGPLLFLNGHKDSQGVMSGTFTCQTRSGGPHYESEEGSFVATPRR